MQRLYPLRFKEILRDYDFGSRRIPEAFDKPGLPAEGVIAETWEVCCRPNDMSVVSNGELAGTALQELIDTRGEELLGTDVTARFGTQFPLLIKFLDVTNVLAEQAHPNDEMAARFNFTDPGKTEAWYMVVVKDGASIRIGNRDGMTRDDVGKAMIDGTAPDLMPDEPLAPGDSFLLYGGTMHYSDGGMILYEIIQNSDAHISLKKLPEDIEEKRKNELIHRAQTSVHVEDGADFRTRHIELTEGANRRSYILACTHFAVERLDLAKPSTLTCDGDRFYVLTQIDGATRVRSGDGEETLTIGNSCLLPACLGDVELIPEGTGSLLKVYVPNLTTDIIEPLRRAGIEDERILRLGGATVLNQLRDLL